MRLTVRQLRALASEMHVAEDALLDMTSGLSPETGMNFPPSSRIARLWRALDLDAAFPRPPEDAFPRPADEGP